MKRIITTILSVVLIASCENGNEFGRFDQLDDSVPKPQAVEVTSVRATSGGAVIKVKIPDDSNIKGVVATYVRNGETVNAKISRYVDSLSVEGYADTEAHEVEVCSFNINEVKSDPVVVTFNPNTPTIQTAKAEVTGSAGGVRIYITGNPEKADLAVCLLRDEDVSHFDLPVSDIQWTEVTTLFTASDSVNLTRRGLDPVEAIYGVYIRDHWGNISDTVKTLQTPTPEIQIPKSKFTYSDPGDDNIFEMESERSYYPLSSLWDDSATTNTYEFFAVDNAPIPAWFTIDLGQVVSLSRITTLPRIDYTIWANAHPRDFEFWGSMSPSGKTGSGEHGFDDSWFCIGKFTQYKPSGYEEDGTVGEYTQEDREYFNSGNDFEIDSSDYPHAFDNLRYLRVVIANTFSTFELKTTTGGIQLGEITPWGQVIE